jgi:hypothetical protein
MSDIYLQITETPSVVTLSAPVVASVMVNTVTVANVVSVNVVTMPSITVQAPSVTTVIGTVTIGNFPSSQAVTFSAVTISNLPSTQAVSLASVPTHGVTLASTTVTVSSLPAISGTVTALGVSNLPLQVAESLFGFDGGRRLGVSIIDSNGTEYSNGAPFPVYFINSIPSGAARIGVVTIGGGTVTIGAGTSQIGSVTASISGTVPVSGTFWQATQPASLASLPALAAGTAQIGSVTASISNTVVTFYPLQGTTVTNTNFTSVTASTTLVSAVAGREVLTVFNEGAGNLHISPGATCTTVAYQVRLSAGDYWECPAGQLSLAHTAVFATAGTARVTEVS